MSENLLPYAVRDRYRYYMDYMGDRVYEIALEEKIPEPREARADIEMVLLVRFLNEYFVLGFENYQRMLEYMEGKHVEGILIGRTEFAKTSAFTRAWSQVADELKQLIVQSGLRRYIDPSTSADEAIRALLRLHSDSSPERTDHGTQ